MMAEPALRQFRQVSLSVHHISSAGLLENIFNNLRGMRHLLLILVSLSLTRHAFASREGSKALMNRSLKIAAEAWKPFWIIYCSDGTEKIHLQSCPRGEMSYGGVLWELLLIMQRTRNISFTMLMTPDSAWGNCNGKNNCTGMVGMVNRGEVDLALGNILIHLLYELYNQGHIFRAVCYDSK